MIHVATIIYSLKKPTKNLYHIFTDLDFWDARRILRDLALVKRNFGTQPPGDRFPTQIIAKYPNPKTIAKIEKRVKRAIPSPPRHIVVPEILDKGRFEFDPSRYFPSRWSASRILYFTKRRLPIFLPPISTPHMTVEVSIRGGKVIIERVPRPFKYDPVIRTKKEALKRLRVPLCF